MQPLQNPLLWVSCPQAARLCSPRKLDVKRAFGPSNHITELNHGQETASDIQKKYIWQYCYKAYYSAKRIIELFGLHCHLKTNAVWSLVFIIAAGHTLNMNAAFLIYETTQIQYVTKEMQLRHDSVWISTKGSPKWHNPCEYYWVCSIIYN